MQQHSSSSSLSSQQCHSQPSSRLCHSHCRILRTDPSMSSLAMWPLQGSNSHCSKWPSSHSSKHSSMASRCHNKGSNGNRWHNKGSKCPALHNTRVSLHQASRPTLASNNKSSRCPVLGSNNKGSKCSILSLPRCPPQDSSNCNNSWAKEAKEAMAPKCNSLGGKWHLPPSTLISSSISSIYK